MRFDILPQQFVLAKAYHRPTMHAQQHECTREPILPHPRSAYYFRKRKKPNSVNKRTYMKRNITQIVLSLSSLMVSGSLFAASPYLDLHALFDTDVFLESGGAGLGSGLDANGSRVDSGTLPLGYADGVPIATQDGRATFKFGDFKVESLDGAIINAQSIAVPAGQYASLDLALLDAPNAFVWPFGAIVFNYADGSKDTNRFGPVAGWFNSPSAFDHAILAATDNSAVTTYADFATTGGSDEAPFLYSDYSSGVDASRRFCDASSYVVYQIPVANGLAHATLGITVGNDFVISVATSFGPDNDPANFPDRTERVDPPRQLIHYLWALGAQQCEFEGYTFDVTTQLADQTGYIYLLFTDATPVDGWGPFIQRVRLYSGTPVYYSQRLDPVVNTSGATVYAMFDVGTTNETPYLFDNSGYGPSNRGHRYADLAGYLTYRFAFPANTANAKLTMDLANNFVVSLRGPGDPVVTYASFVPFTAGESNYLVDISCCTGNDGGHRFMDADNYVVYQFTLPADASNALAHIQIANEYLVQARSGTSGDWTTELAELNQGGVVFRDVDLSAYLTNNPAKVIQIRIGDTSTADGWGGYLVGMSIVNHLDTADWQPVLDSQTLFGDDVHNEFNKGYYTIDLSSALANNPTKEVFVKFTDGSTSDGWGPGIFWMAAYSGDIDIQSDRLVFNGLKSTLGEPTQNYGLDILQRRYPLDPSRTLSSIVLPAKPTDPGTTDSKVYLLAATLNAAPPTLGIVLQPGNTVLLSWTTSAPDYSLQSTTNLVSPQWTTVTASTCGGGRPNYGDAIGGRHPLLSPGQVIQAKPRRLPGESQRPSGLRRSRRRRREKASNRRLEFQLRAWLVGPRGFVLALSTASVHSQGVQHGARVSG